MTRLWLVRHGPTHARGMCGWSDLPADLSDHAAINRLSLYLPDAPVIASDLIRAVATASAIGTDRPRLPDDPDLREMHFGAWEMRSHSEVETESPALIRAFWDEPGTIKAPGGESWDDLRSRVDAADDRLLARNLPDLIIVAHFGAILTQLQRAGGMSAQQVFSHKIDNLSVTELAWRSATNEWSVGQINYIP